MQLPPNTIIASGPVIIEDGKVLLNREKKGDRETLWFFPGGEVEDFDSSLEQACAREVKEEMGIEIEIVKPLKPMIVRRPESGTLAILIHFLAKRIGEILPGESIIEWRWHDIQRLPENCAENVKEVIKEYLEKM